MRIKIALLAIVVGVSIISCASSLTEQRLRELENQNKQLTQQIRELSETIKADKEDLGYIHFELGLLRKDIAEKQRPKPDSSQIEQINKLIKDLTADKCNIQEIATKLSPFGKGAIAAMSEALRTADTQHRTRIESTLSLMPQADATPILLATLKDKAIRVSAARVLGNLNDRSAISPLAESLSGVDENFTFVVAESLTKLKDKRGIPALIELLKSTTPSIRAMAINLLANLNKGENFGYKHYVETSERQPAIGKWEDWWLKQAETFTFPQ